MLDPTPKDHTPKVSSTKIRTFPWPWPYCWQIRRIQESRAAPRRGDARAPLHTAIELNSASRTSDVLRHLGWKKNKRFTSCIQIASLENFQSEVHEYCGVLVEVAKGLEIPNFWCFYSDLAPSEIRFSQLQSHCNSLTNMFQSPRSNSDMQFHSSRLD